MSSLFLKMQISPLLIGAILGEKRRRKKKDKGSFEGSEGDLAVRGGAKNLEKCKQIMDEERKRKKGRRTAGAVGQTGWPTAPIHSLNPLHHAAGVADPAAAYGGECRSLEFLSAPPPFLSVLFLLKKRKKRKKPFVHAAKAAWPSGRAPDPDGAGQNPGSTVWD